MQYEIKYAENYIFLLHMISFSVVYKHLTTFPVSILDKHKEIHYGLKMNCNWFNALKPLSIIFFVFLLNTKYFSQAEEIPNESRDDDSDSLQISEPDEARLAKRAWNQLQRSWGKRSFDAPTEEELRKLNQNEDYFESIRSYDYEPLRFRDYNMITDSDDFETTQGLGKRAWKSMNGAWGKRDWSQLKGNGCGKKREPGNWNNLRGLWGKRSAPQNWNKLSSAWGK